VLLKGLFGVSAAFEVSHVASHADLWLDWLFFFRLFYDWGGLVGREFEEFQVQGFGVFEFFFKLRTMRYMVAQAFAMHPVIPPAKAHVRKNLKGLLIGLCRFFQSR
jgi:hypothetical protein